MDLMPLLNGTDHQFQFHNINIYKEYILRFDHLVRNFG